MPSKKTTAAAPAKKVAVAPAHASYKDMIKEAILTLKERNGSSRQGLKKYILANNKSTAATPAIFDSQFNKALRNGVEKGDFTQPKGASGPVKLAKKEPATKPAAATAAPAKKASTSTTTTTTTTKPTSKKAAAPKKTATKAKATTTATKKAPAAKKATVTKANTGTKRKSKTPSSAPAVVDVPKVLGKTKSGRVTKTTAKPAAPKKAAVKKAAPKKATPKKKAAPLASAA